MRFFSRLILMISILMLSTGCEEESSPVETTTPESAITFTWLVPADTTIRGAYQLRMSVGSDQDLDSVALYIDHQTLAHVFHPETREDTLTWEFASDSTQDGAHVFYAEAVDRYGFSAFNDPRCQVSSAHRRASRPDRTSRSITMPGFLLPQE